jgi:ribosomal protein L7/L12
LLKQFPDTKSILDRMASISNMPEEELLLQDVINPETKVDLLQKLIENSKTFHVGILIKSIWSGLHIPYHHILPSDQPMGGVSDISNKGDFGRLLISEYANEDMVFLSRIANNEALYLNREVPPVSNNHERIILLDVSIKTWGTARNVAFAIMLAIIKHPKSNINCKVYAVGDSFSILKVDTIEDIINSLQILGATISPALGIDILLKYPSISRKSEIFLLSTNETLMLPTMQKVLSDHNERINYWINTDVTGKIEVYKRLLKAKKHVQTLKLPISELWKNDLVTSVKENHSNADILRCVYPILFTTTLNPKKVLITDDGTVFQITQNRDLLKHNNIADKYSRGWEMIYEKLPFISGEFEIGISEENEFLLLAFNMQDRKLHLMNLSNGEKMETHFSGWKNSYYKEFIFHKNNFYFFTNYPEKTWKVSFEKKLDILIIDGFSDELKHAYQNRVETLKQLLTKMPTTAGVLRNISKVYLDSMDNLVVNGHKLCLTTQGDIRFEQAIHSASVYWADKSNLKNEFNFGNKLVLSFSSSGMMVLKDTTLSGHEKHTLVLHRAGSNRLSLVKSINIHLQLGLAESKKLVDGHMPVVLKKNLSKSEAENLKAKIVDGLDNGTILCVGESVESTAIFIPTVLDTNLGICTSDEFCGNPFFLLSETFNNKKIINNREFWLKHITPFLEKIKNYATTT